jgi:hypothetical protein
LWLLKPTYSSGTGSVLSSTSGDISHFIVLDQFVVAIDSRRQISKHSIAVSTSYMYEHGHVLFFGKDSIVRLQSVLFEELFAVTDLEIQLRETSWAGW